MLKAVAFDGRDHSQCFEQPRHKNRYRSSEQNFIWSIVFFLTATQRECIGWSERGGQHIAVLPLNILPSSSKLQFRDFLSQIFLSITLGNLGIQDLKHSKQRTQSYESCSYDQICDTNTIKKMHLMIQNGFTVDFCL